MPVRAPRICGCGHRVASSERCPCEAKRKAQYDQRRPSARERGYDTEYQRLASAFLKEHRRCTCGQPAVLVRHKISIRLRPDLRMSQSNWLPGCRACNAKDVQREQRTKTGAVSPPWER
ncbi:hypothetical protein [Ancylobacter sp. FA202]|uniref:hypothetical protein n=1 Tax=Ancylobacter sp. FA202 TaxID=1111106 RepID=UPI00036810A9|nr:hypothetical protein [Ancylobacter sp. FA202]